jgi:hypothetical protein
MKAFLQFGGAALGMPAGPFQTIEVPAKYVPLPWQERGLQETATGYGRRLTSPYMVRWEGRWRRVYVAQFSNAGTAYIGKPGAWIATVDVEPESL